MQIRHVNNTPNFQAKFLNSESLKLVTEYAIEHNKFDKLNLARKNIDKFYLQRRIRVDVGENNGKPFVSFARFSPKNSVIVPKTMSDLKLDKVVIIQSEQKGNMLKFALEKLIKLSNNAPDNKMFQNIIAKK